MWVFRLLGKEMGRKECRIWVGRWFVNDCMFVGIEWGRGEGEMRES